MTINPGGYSASATSQSHGGNPVVVPHQQYMRTAVYADGELVLATPWQFRSTTATTQADSEEIAAIASIALLYPRNDVCPLLLPVGTHATGSSLTDQQILCLKMIAAGASLLTVFTMVANSPGGWPAIYSGTALFPEVIPHLPVDTAPPPEIAALADLARRLATSQHEAPNGQRVRIQISFDAVKAVRAACIAYTFAPDDCGGIHIFSPGGLYSPQSSQHNLDAITSGQPPVLTWLERDKRKSRYWYVGDRRCDGTSVLLHCDEYPYNSTTAGGPGASLKKLPADDNINEGAQLRAFYTVCGLSQAPAGSSDRNFLVLPIPAATQPTTYICNK